MYRMDKKSLYVPLPNLACRYVHASHMPHTLHNDTHTLTLTVLPHTTYEFHTVPWYKSKPT